MIVKIVSLFLIGIAVLAMFGRLKLRLPRIGGHNAKKCDRCGQYRIGRAPCACGRL